MTDHPTDFVGDVNEAVASSIKTALPDAAVEVSGGGGHYRISVVSTGFAGKNMLEQQRIVLRSIKHLMNGERAPVHAVDSLITKTP